MTVGQPAFPSSASVGDQRTQAALPHTPSELSLPRVIIPYPPQPFSGAPQCPYGCPPADPHSGPQFPPGSAPYLSPYGSQAFAYAYSPQPFGYPSLYPPAPQQAAPKRRQQVKTACTNCAAACKKCEEARPCDRCVKYNIADTCVSAVRKERKKGVKRGPYKKKEKDVAEPKATDKGSPTRTAPAQSGSPAPALHGEAHSPPKYSPPPAFATGVPPLPQYLPPPPEGHPYPYWYPPPPPHYLPPPLGENQDGRHLTQAPPPYPYYGLPLHAAYPPYPLYPSLPYPPPTGPVSAHILPASAPVSPSSGSVASASPSPPSAGRDTEGKHVHAHEGVSPGGAKRKIIVWDEHPGPQPAAKRSRCADGGASI